MVEKEHLVTAERRKRSRQRKGFSSACGRLSVALKSGGDRAYRPFLSIRRGGVHGIGVVTSRLRKFKVGVQLKNGPG